MLIKMRVFIIFILMMVLSNCSKPDMEITYYPNGQIKFEVPVKNGRWHGMAKGYYESGKLRGEVEYINGKEEGLWYDLDEQEHLLERRNYHNGILIGHEVYNSGILFGKTFYDSLGRPQDIRQYKKNGERDMNFTSLIVYTVPDTVKLGDKTLFFTRLGNADSTKINKGYLLITSSLDSLRSNAPIDTLADISSTNEKGFLYEFIPLKKGDSQIFGSLRFVDSRGSIVYGPHPFIYEFEVR